MRARTIAIILLVSASFSLRGGAAENPASGEIRMRYDKLQEPKKKLEFVIELIDAGVIKRGVTLDFAKEIFGDDAWVNVDESGRSVCTVNFEKLPEWTPPSDFREGDRVPASARIGWYLRLKTDSKGYVIDYFLSNRHK